MEGKRLLRSLKLQNFLSFGSEGVEIELEPLNVLIGPNASGKSNFLDAIGLLHSTPLDISRAIYYGGGVGDWLWKGSQETPTALIGVSVDYGLKPPLSYKISFTEVGFNFRIVEESIEEEGKGTTKGKALYSYKKDIGKFSVKSINGKSKNIKGKNNQFIETKDLNPFLSVLSQRKDPITYPEITYLGKIFGVIFMYRSWLLGRFGHGRIPQKMDKLEYFPMEDMSNLALFLSRLEMDKAAWQTINDNLQKAHNLFEKIFIETRENTSQINFHEKGLYRSIPATRASDGTMRLLFLTAILNHPSPPPLICIEEPELGLHPDIIHSLADLLIDASKRTQIIVTTHSDLLVSALAEVPESVVVCEHGIDGTTMQRLEKKKLKKWLKDYSLGELWLSGELGGTRW